MNARPAPSILSKRSPRNPELEIEIPRPGRGRIAPVNAHENGTARIEGDEVVVVHVERETGPCQACGSTNVVTIRVSEEDSPLWVAVCAQCDEHVWSLDD
jgi:hypothetical protein